MQRDPLHAVSSLSWWYLLQNDSRAQLLQPCYSTVKVPFHHSRSAPFIYPFPIAYCPFYTILGQQHCISGTNQYVTFGASFSNQNSYLESQVGCLIAYSFLPGYYCITWMWKGYFNLWRSHSGLLFIMRKATINICVRVFIMRYIFISQR